MRRFEIHRTTGKVSKLKNSAEEPARIVADVRISQNLGRRSGQQTSWLREKRTYVCNAALSTSMARKNYSLLHQHNGAADEDSLTIKAEFGVGCTLNFRMRNAIKPRVDEREKKPN